MTKAEMMMLITNGAAGVLDGVGGAQQASQNQRSQQQNQQNFTLQQLINSLQNQQQTSQGLYDQHGQGAAQQAALSPLGGEQSFVQKQRMLQALIPAIAGFKPGAPTDPAIAGSFTPPTNVLGSLNSPGLMQSVGDQATAQSLSDRRQMMANINPDFNFGSLDSFGLGSQYDQGFQQSSMDAKARQTAHEAQQNQLAQRQTDLTSQAYQNAGQQGSSAQGKGGGVKGFLGGLLKTASPLAALIPGVGPLAAIGIGAAGGALGNKLQGGGLVSGAVQGGVGAGIGAAGKSLASGQGLNPFNNGAGPIMNNAMSSASLPVTGFMPDLTQKTNPLLQATPQGLSGLAGSVAQNKPDIQKMMAITGGPQAAALSKGPTGMNPQGYPLKNVAPFRGVNPTPNAGGDSQLQRGGPGETAMWGAYQSLMEQPLVKQLQNPAAMLMLGAVAGQTPQAEPLAGYQMAQGATRPAVVDLKSMVEQSRLPKQPGLPTVGPQPSPIERMGRQADFNTQYRNAQFDQQWKQGMATPSYNDKKSLLNGINAVGANNGMSMEENQNMLAALQELMKRVVGGR